MKTRTRPEGKDGSRAQASSRLGRLHQGGAVGTEWRRGVRAEPTAFCSRPRGAAHAHTHREAPGYGPHSPLPSLPGPLRPHTRRPSSLSSRREGSPAARREGGSGSPPREGGVEGNAPAITHVGPDETPPQDTLSMDLAVGNQNALLEKIPEGSGVNFTPRLLCQ